MNRKIDDVIKYLSPDCYIGGGSLGKCNTSKKRKTPVNKTKKGVKKGK